MGKVANSHQMMTVTVEHFRQVSHCVRESLGLTYNEFLALIALYETRATLGASDLADYLFAAEKNYLEHFAHSRRSGARLENGRRKRPSNHEMCSDGQGRRRSRQRGRNSCQIPPRTIPSELARRRVFQIYARFLLGELRPRSRLSLIHI